MPLVDEEGRFLDALKRTRRWSGLGKGAFHELLYGHGSDSTEDRLERGETKTKTGSPDARLRLARLVIEKTECPPALFGLSELEREEADRLRREFEQKLVEQKNELRAEAQTEREVLEARLLSLETAVRRLK